MQALARMAPGHTEGALAVARAALDAREFATARAALEPLAKEPTQRVAMLMAELEGLEGDEGRAREWMARALHAARDPAWTADGFVSERWLPVSPVTGRLDAFQWKVPVADLAERRAARGRARGAEAPALPPRGAVAAAQRGAGAGRRPQCLRNAPAVARAPMRPAPIIPLAQVPDDPGPEPEDAELVAPGPLATDSSAFPVKLGRPATDRPASGVPVVVGIVPAVTFLRFCPQATIQAPEFAAVAQLVEHLIRNEGVGGSSPFRGTMYTIDITRIFLFLLRASQLLFRKVTTA